MHKSKLSGFIIDCQTEDLEAAAAFWSAALGMEVQALGPEEENYLQLLDRQHGLHIEVQRVMHPSRVHLDIETDDVEAEVNRLVGLGARKVEKIRSWWVMEAPTGQRFCVVRKSTEGFADKANVWQNER
jgi:predicted enzyme related to lactoylglutathione lyase